MRSKNLRRAGPKSSSPSATTIFRAKSSAKWSKVLTHAAPSSLTSKTIWPNSSSTGWTCTGTRRSTGRTAPSCTWRIKRTSNLWWKNSNRHSRIRPSSWRQKLRLVRTSARWPSTWRGCWTRWISSILYPGIFSDLGKRKLDLEIPWMDRIKDLWAW